MVNNSYKLLFCFSLILGTMMAVSSFSWFSMWMGLEINLLSFIPLMMSTKNLFSSESSLKYFLTQALASSVFLFAILLIFIFFNEKIMTYYSNFFFILISSSLMMKMGGAPFHFWFPTVSEGLNWFSLMVLMTWQKIAPLMLFSYMINFYFLIWVIFFSMIFGSLGGLNQTSLRKLMAYSSINHLGWMMASMMNNENLWFTYFIFYCFLSLSIIWIFNFFKLNNINQTFYLKKTAMFLNLTIFISLLSLGGLPPFLGFFPKWIIIEMMIFKKLFFILNFMLFLTLITLFFYMRISYNSLLLKTNEMAWNYKMKNFSLLKKNMNLLAFFTFFSLFGLMMINLFFMFI